MQVSDPEHVISIISWGQRAENVLLNIEGPQNEKMW